MLFFINFSNIVLLLMITPEERKIIDQFSGALLMENYPPLAGKIVGLFFVTEKTYYTFDEMLEVFDTNKTALSRALKFLGSFNIINSIQKEHIKRRRYFYLDIPNYIKYIGVFAQYFNKLNSLIKSAQQIRGSKNPEMNDFIEEYIAYNDKILQTVNEHLKSAFTKDYSKKGNS